MKAVVVMRTTALAALFAGACSEDRSRPVADVISEIDQVELDLCEFVIESDEGELKVLATSLPPAGNELFRVEIATSPVADPSITSLRGILRFLPAGADPFTGTAQMSVEYQELGSTEAVEVVAAAEAVEAYEHADDAKTFAELVADLFYGGEASTPETPASLDSRACGYTGCGNQGNHAGCDKRGGAQNSCAANARCPRIHARLRGECCDNHDACISQHCGAPGNPVTGAPPNQSYPCGAANHPPSLQCTAACQACHREVIGCFARFRGHSDSACCAAGTCGRQQLCMINGVVITDAATCRANGLGMCVGDPAPAPMPMPGP